MLRVRDTSLENPTTEYNNDYVLSILTSAAAIAAVVVFISLYETTPLNSFIGLFLVPILGFMMYFAAVIFCIILKVLIKSKPNCYILSNAEYNSVINLVLTFFMDFKSWNFSIFHF